MQTTVVCARGDCAPGTRARGAARANLAGAFGQVLATYAAPTSVILTLFLQEQLHVEKWHIGVIAALTFLGPTFEPPGAYLAGCLGRRRPLFLALFLANRVPFLAFVFLPFFAARPECRSGLIDLVLLLVALTRVPCHLATPAWWSWMGDLVPERRRGRFFGCRNQAVNAVGALSFVAGMGLLQTCGGLSNAWLVSGLFAVGALFGIADILLYFQVPEPPPLPAPVRLASFALPFRQTEFRRLLLGMGLWSFSANLALPFLPVYQHGETLGGCRLGLGLSWLFLAVLNVSGSLAAMLSSRWWALWSDRLGPRRLLLLGSGYLFVNFAYLVVGPERHLGVLVPVALASGALNAAWTVSVNQLLLGLAPRAERGFFVSAFNFTNGWLMASGPLLGGWFADRLPVLGWHLPGGLPCCYFHVLLVLSGIGGAAALSLLARVPVAEPALEWSLPVLGSQLRRWAVNRVHKPPLEPAVDNEYAAV